MLTDQQLSDAPKAAGTNQRETPEERAIRLLRTLLPTFRSRDHALESLYLVYPDAKPNERHFGLWLLPCTS